jgi:hypothetical protein
MKCRKLSLWSCSFHVFALFRRVVAGSSGGGAVSTVAVTANAAASGAVVSGNQH